MQPNRLSCAQRSTELRPALRQTPIMNLHKINCALLVSKIIAAYRVKLTHKKTREHQLDRLGLERRGDKDTPARAPVHPHTGDLACLVVAGPVVWREADGHGEDDEDERKRADVGWVHGARLRVQVLVRFC